MFDFFKKKEKGIEIGSPVKGKTVAISNVSDPTFGEEILGKGVAIIPAEGRIYAPADGTIEMLFDTMHAVSMTTSEGVELLIHIGLDTVALKGEHFTAYKGNGDSVKKGELLIEADLDAVKKAGYDVITPVVVCARSRRNRRSRIPTVRIKTSSRLHRMTGMPWCRYFSSVTES